MNEPVERREFPNLTALRGVAAAMVVGFHIEQLRAILGMPHLWNVPAVRWLGKAGVVLFFVLSGYLITSLLVRERRHRGTIDVGGFYLRRLLRIWPLYFTVVALALFVFPLVPVLTLPGYPAVSVHTHLLGKSLCYLFFLPNVVLTSYGYVPYAVQTWTIGAEEQFYLVWPWILRRTREQLAPVLVAIIVIYLAIQLLLRHVGPPFVAYLWNDFSIASMAIGGLYATLDLQSWPKLTAWVYSRPAQIGALFVIALFFVRGKNFWWLDVEIHSLAFGLLVANLAANPDRLFDIDHPITRRLGTLSYGTYMWHHVAIVLSIRGLGASGLLTATTPYLSATAVIYPVALGLTLLFAQVSYGLIEQPFLKLKNRFSRA